MTVRLRRLDLFNPSYKFVEREGNIPLSLGIDSLCGDNIDQLSVDNKIESTDLLMVGRMICWVTSSINTLSCSRNGS